jgi:DNA-3-methyladenine glycosylase II
MVIGRRKASPLTSDAIDENADVARGVAHLVACEPRFQAIVLRHGMPPPRRVDNSLPSLLRIVTEQLLSLKAAEAIWRRLEANIRNLDPADIIAADVDVLKSHGLSTAKACCFLALAKAVAHGELDFTRLAAMPDADALRALQSLPGIGPWTAEIYLLTALGRMDICPSGDLALQIAAQDLLGLEARPTPREFLVHAERWRPWRSVAARLLWSHYRGLKGLPQTVN